jgi:DNA-binding MarR family transcriptional regulator
MDAYQILARFRYFIREFLATAAEGARSVGLEPRHYELLLAIRGLPAGMEPTVGDIAQQLQIRHHSAVELIDRAVGRGLVERQRPDDNRKVVLVRVTPAGMELLERLVPVRAGELKRHAPMLLETLRGLLPGDRGKSGRSPGTRR